MVNVLQKLQFFFIFWSLFFVVNSPLSAQTPFSASRSITIPYEYHNNFIVINAIFNKVVPIRLILDTGSEYTILTKRGYADLFNFPYEREIPLIGSDRSLELTAYLVRRINLRLPNMRGRPIDFLILDDDYFQFERYTGIEIQGILGANFFRSYVLKIDYRKQKITLIPKRLFRPPPDFAHQKISIMRGKPYINTQIQIDSTQRETTLLLDTGASLSLVLEQDSISGIIPPKHIIQGKIASGLGGQLDGVAGRIRKLQLLDYELEEVATNFQDTTNQIYTSAITDRNGLIGNQILSRFTMIIDYFSEDLYLRPNKSFKKQFRYDRSGLLLIAGGKNLSKIYVQSVVPGSPADLAGIKKGDQIMKVGWLGAKVLGLESIIRRLKGKVGKRIKLKLKREGRTIRTEFRLKELI